MKTKLVSIHELKEAQIKVMYSLMAQYYDHVSEEIFRQDLKEKQQVILLLSPSEAIVGFSTILQLRLTSADSEFIALYSGDTVLEKQYWGNGGLATAFGSYLLKVKMENPMTEVFWFLITKGYKTYLLMTNNFPTHFPRHEFATPAKYERIMDAFYQKRFGSRYDSGSKLIRMEEEKLSGLKVDVAEIADDLRANPRVAYFEKMNPQWDQGIELACVAKVTLWIPFRYMIKRIVKFILRTKPQGQRILAKKIK